MGRIGKRSSKETQKAIAEAATLSCNIKDIRDELNIIKTIVRYQDKVQNSPNHKKGGREDSKHTIPGNERKSASYIVEDITGMDRAADRIHAAVGIPETPRTIHHCCIKNRLTHKF